MIDIHCTSAIELLASLDNESVDLVVTDPPYGIGYASNWKTRRNGQPRLNMPDFGDDVFDSSWLPEVGRVLKDGGALYLFTRWDVLPAWQGALEAAVLKVVQRLIWDKTHWGMGDLRYYGSQTEDILFAVKGEHIMRWEKRQGNVFRGSKYYLAEGKYDHPTQKPEAVIARFVLNSSSPGDLVCDPFLGSGTTAVVCKTHGRRFVGGDIREDYVQMSVDRVAKQSPPLFVMPAPEQIDLFD